MLIRQYYLEPNLWYVSRNIKNSWYTECLYADLIWGPGSGINTNIHDGSFFNSKEEAEEVFKCWEHKDKLGGNAIVEC